MAVKPLDFYLHLPYTIEVTRDSGEEVSGLFARVVELPGCMTQADTFAELEAMIEDAMRGWIEAALESGQDIPEPHPKVKYSGKFIVRVPRSLHRALVETAEREGVSLNMFVSTALGKAVGHANPEIKKEYPQGYHQPRPKRLVNDKTDPSF
jgi:antitoxin HicB